MEIVKGTDKVLGDFQLAHLAGDLRKEGRIAEAEQVEATLARRQAEHAQPAHQPQIVCA
jgi:hypothetical protein